MATSTMLGFYAISIITTSILFVFSYLLLFHPLRNYPGPFLAKFTDGYGGFHAIKKQSHLTTYHDHLKYGSVFRQAPNRLVFNTSTALRAIYLNPGINKASIYKKTQLNPQTNIFGNLDRERHQQKRKIYGKVLSDRSLRIFEPTMSSEIDIFLQQLSKHNHEAVNMSPLCERLTTDIAGQLAFGQPLNTQVEATNRLFPRAMVSMNGLVNIFMSWPMVSRTWPLLRRLNKRNGLTFIKAIQDIVQRRMTIPQDGKHDFYSIAAGDGGLAADTLRNSELWAEAVFFLPAGGTTLSAALSAIFFYLSRDLNVYSRLATEIRTTFSSEDQIKSGAQLSGCKYLRATIDETLRVAPPFTGTLWREPYSDYNQPFVVDGKVIPRGTMVGVNPYCIMHNEEYFPEPFRFRPERWLESEQESIDEEKQRVTMRAAFAPFALGETGCLGKGMAYHEMSLVVAKTLWRFDFQKASGQLGKLGEGHPGQKGGRNRVEEYQLLDLAVADHDGPNLTFSPIGNGF